MSRCATGESASWRYDRLERQAPDCLDAAASHAALCDAAW
jgi:hypothetical protein